MHSGLLFSLRKINEVLSFAAADGTGGHSAKGNKPGTERKIEFSFTCGNQNVDLEK